MSEFDAFRPEAALPLAREAAKSGDLEAVRVLMVVLADLESRQEALRIGEEQLREKAESALILQSMAEIASFRCRGELRTKAGSVFRVLRRCS